MADVNITYETLFEILRNEKNKDDLQELSPTFYQDVITYLNKNKDMLDQALANNAPDDEKEDTIRQLKNIKNLVKEIYERREKKIINIALNKSRTKSNSIEAETLLPQERDFYNECVRILDSYRNTLLLAMLNGTVPEATSTSIETRPPIPQTNQPEVEEERKESAQESAPIPPSPQEYENKEVVPETTSSVIENTTEVTETTQAAEITQTAETTHATEETNKAIKFKDTVPKFLGKELEVYGPFEPEDTATLPQELADILIKKGKAEEMQNSAA